MRKIERNFDWREADRERLERLVRDRNTPQKVEGAYRAAGQRRAHGRGDRGGSGKSVLTVRRWRRYVAVAVTIAGVRQAARDSGC
jgi:hypothetical protein